jgi:hypothetical protein
MASVQKCEQVIAAVAAWAASRRDIVGLALVGSHAGEAARVDSDIDLMLLTPERNNFCHSHSWLSEIDWSIANSSVAEWRDVQYGVAWSCHVHRIDGTAI